MKLNFVVLLLYKSGIKVAATLELASQDLVTNSVSATTKSFSEKLLAEL